MAAWSYMGSKIISLLTVRGPTVIMASKAEACPSRAAMSCDQSSQPIIFLGKWVGLSQHHFLKSKPLVNGGVLLNSLIYIGNIYI